MIISESDNSDRQESLRISAQRLVRLTLLILLTAHFSLLTVSASAWSRQQSGTMAWLRAVYFLDQNRGWVAGSNGTLLKTIDGGSTWKKLLALTKDTLHDVYFADEQNGWLIAERDLLKLNTNDEPRSYLLQTEDGGITWRRIFLRTQTNARLLRLVFADAHRGWVFGESGIVLATVDGGTHWTPQSSPTRYLLLGGTLVDNSRLWLVGAGATIIQTSDGGSTWRKDFVRNAANTRFTAAAFAGNNLGWAVGTAGTIFTTADGGRLWYAQQSPVDEDLFDIKFVDATEGWAAGSEGVLLHTNDGGAHWSAQPSGTSHSLQRLFFIEPNHGWAVGFGGTILKYGNAQIPVLRK
jgi:photosystem II stability/assembly factor-like uncharacterized protein